MVSDYIKVFIEDNKDIIEDNDWQQFWDNYIDYADTILFYEDSYLDELMNLLFTSGVNDPQQSFKYRENSVKRKLVDRLFNIANQNKHTRVPRQAKMSWSTVLGLTQEELLKVMDEVASTYGYESKRYGYFKYIFS